MDEENNKINTLDYCFQVKNTIENFLKMMNVDFDDIEIFKGLSDNGPRFIIKSRESGILIGHRGENLKAINHITRKIILKNNGIAKFIIDINNYQEDNVKKIKNIALQIAQKVRDSKESIEMEPMSSYERMIVHSLFSLDSDIKTESVGERGQRRIVIKPNNR